MVGLLPQRIEGSNRSTIQLISGHRGCGKSTELLRLADRMGRENFLVVYFAADDDIDMGDLVYTDLLLSIIKRLERTLSLKGIAFN